MNVKWGRYLLYTVILLLLTAVLAVSAILAIKLFRYDTKIQRKSELHPIIIEGEYSEEGGAWKPLTLQTKFDNLTFRNITVKGHFSRELPVGEYLYLNLDQVWVSLKVNGEEIYSLLPEGREVHLTQAMGRQYAVVESPGITAEDTIELNFGNYYINSHLIQFDELLWEMYAGDSKMMFFEAVKNDAFTLGLGTVFLFLTMFLLITAFCCAILRSLGVLRFLWLGFGSFFAGVWFITLSSAITLILPWPIFLNVLFAFSMQGMAIFLLLFIGTSLTGLRRKLMIACQIVLLMVLLVGLINQLLGIQDLYSAINYFSFFDLVAVVCSGCCLGYEAFHMKREEPRALLRALSLLIVCAVAELVNGYIQFFQAAFVLGLGFLSFIALEGIYMLYRVKRSMESEKKNLILQNELNQNQIKIMISQIQPHFLYNALNTIHYLCKSKPKEAEKAIENFAAYLRGNMDALTQNTTIPFSRELEHLENYLAIERLRFPDLNVVYDLKAEGFWLPALTIQPLVENAIKHGIRKSQKGNTVRISSWELEKCWCVRVEDDGAGFECEQLPLNDGRSHIGLINTRCRIERMCQGTFVISSIKDVGTVVTITIPKKN